MAKKTPAVGYFSLFRSNRHFLVKFWKCQNAVTILPHETKALLNYFAFNQSYLAKGKIAPVILMPHVAK